MRFYPLVLLALVIVGACDDAPCRPNEFKVGMVCYQRRSPDGGAEADPSEIGEVHEREGEPDARTGDARTGMDAASELGPAVAGHETVDAGTAAGGAASGEVMDGAVVPDAAADTGPACVPSAEVCDGNDNDCDQQVDEGAAEAPIGADCSNGGSGVCKQGGKQVCFGGAIICNAPPPMPSSEDCDGIDDDCNGKIDDGLVNTCGGNQCAADLKQLGQKCTAGDGDCVGEGTYVCDAAAGNNAVRCNAVAKPKTCGESCGALPTWFPDCDGDTFAALSGALQSCIAPNVAGCKQWLPNTPQTGLVDCDDKNPARYPGAEPIVNKDKIIGVDASAFNGDINCNGQLEMAAPDVFAYEYFNDGVVHQAGGVARHCGDPGTESCYAGNLTGCHWPTAVFTGATYTPAADGGLPCGLTSITVFNKSACSQYEAIARRVCK